MTGLSSTVYSQTEESLIDSNRLIVIGNDTLYTLNKMEARNVATLVIKYKRDTERLEASLKREKALEDALSSTNKIADNYKKEAEAWEALFNITDNQLESHQLMLKDEKKESFNNGLLIGSGATALLILGLGIFLSQ